MRQFLFYKSPYQKWYIDLPEFEESIDELEMIMGADTMLDIISQGENKIKIHLSLEFFDNCETLEKIEDTPGIGGAYYIMKSYKGIEYNLKLWLCDITKFIFGFMPNFIYIK